MNKFFTRLLVALFTFVIGLTITSVFLFFTQSPEVKVISDSPATDLKDERNFSKNEIQYHVTATNEKPNIGIFKVVIGYYESSYSADYNKNASVRNRKNNENFLKPSCCPYGLDLQKLTPNKTAIFEAPNLRK